MSDESQQRLANHMARLGAGLLLLKEKLEAPITRPISHSDYVEFQFEGEEYLVVTAGCPPMQTRRAAPQGDAQSLQRRLYDECVAASWDPDKRNTFAEEIAHLHEELSEAFRAWRRYKDCQIREVNGKLEGVPIEFADALIGMFYNAELHGFDLLAAVEQKHQYNLTRNYVKEGRQLHASADAVLQRETPR